MFLNSVGSFIYLLNIKLLLCAGYCIGAGNSEISRNRHDLVFIEFIAYPGRNVKNIIPQMSGHNCDHALLLVTSQEGFPREAVCVSRSEDRK